MKRGMAKAERLREMERLYLQRGYSDGEMAARLGIDRSTVYRDRLELSREAPIVNDDAGRWKIDRSGYLSNVRVNLNEALALYLAARRASQQTRISQPHLASGLEKLAMALRQPMTARLSRIAQDILAQQASPERVKVLETVARAWAEGLKLRLSYQSLKAARPYNYLVSPYLIEPSPWSDAAYLIGFSDVHGDLTTFKIERIEHAWLTTEPFSIPADFDEAALLRYAWGIWYGEGEPVKVTLRFAAGVAARRLKESVWHPTQQISELEDGGCLWQAQVAEWQEMLPWIRGWGAAVEVLEPQGLREELKREARRLVNIYDILQEHDGR